MQSRLLINAGLLLFVIAAATFLILGDSKETEPAVIKVSDINPDSITRIQINNLSGKEIVFVKESEQWNMQTPYTAPAHPTRMSAILGILDSISLDRLKLDEVKDELNRFQLDPANATLQLNDAVFKFGDVNPLNQSRYVLHDDKIHLIQDRLYQQLSTNPTFFINPKILPDETAITSITTPEYVLNLNEDEWLYDSEKQRDEETVSHIIEGWKGLEANTIQPLEFEESNHSIVITLNDNKQIEYLIKPESPNLILGRKETGLQYHISEYHGELIFPVVVEVSDATTINENNE